MFKSTKLAGMESMVRAEVPRAASHAGHRGRKLALKVRLALTLSLLLLLPR